MCVTYLDIGYEDNVLDMLDENVDYYVSLV